MGKKEKKSKSIVWFGGDGKFDPAWGGGEKGVYKGIDYGSGPVDHGGKKDSRETFEPFHRGKGPYLDIFGKSKSTKKKKRKK